MYEEHARKAAEEFLRARLAKGRMWIRPHVRGGVPVEGYWREVDVPTMVPHYTEVQDRGEGFTERRYGGGTPLATGRSSSRRRGKGTKTYHFDLSDGRRLSFWRSQKRDDEGDLWWFGVTVESPDAEGGFSYRSPEDHRTFDIRPKEQGWELGEGGWKTRWGEDEYKTDIAPSLYKNKAAAERDALSHSVHGTRVTDPPGPLDILQPHKESASTAPTVRMKPTKSPLEGPFKYPSGWEGYYDPAEGRYLGLDDIYMPRDFDPHAGR